MVDSEQDDARSLPADDEHTESPEPIGESKMARRPLLQAGMIAPFIVTLSARPASAAQMGSAGNYNYAGDGGFDDWEVVEQGPVAEDAPIEAGYYGDYYDK